MDGGQQDEKLWERCLPADSGGESETVGEWRLSYHMLRDFLNEFQLDWAMAPVRSGMIPREKINKKRVLLAGGEDSLRQALAWSFLAWNEKEGVAVKAEQYGEGEEIPEESFREADYIVFPGLCSAALPQDPYQCMAWLDDWFRLLKRTADLSAKARLILLSDGRSFGKLKRGFAASEYEEGKTDPLEEDFSAQYIMQAAEGIFISWAKENRREFNILRTGWVYGPGIFMLDHPLGRLARLTAAGEEREIPILPDQDSYTCIHDLLTALQFVLTRCPAGKVFHVTGLDSDATAGEMALILHRNFPELCRLNLVCREAGENKGILLNTQLLRHYGFEPRVSLEDGLIILVKSLQNTGEVFIFDNTYLGKLEKVHEILLAYLLEIDRICRKHNIKYFLAGGTLLGAIRHKGFIPWDDDADVMMLREDYDRFLEVVRDELPENIFLQLPWTEKGNHNPFTKLRIDNTLFATEFTGHFMDMHNGIFFDVLSHDKTGNHSWSQKLHLMITMLTRSIVFNKWGNTDIKGGGAHPLICKFVDKAKYLIPMRFAEWAQNKALTFFKNRDSDYLYDGMGRNLKRGAFPKKWLDEAVYVEFEGYQFPVPRDYDQYLAYLYGDYMQMIPVSQRRTSHSIVVMDLGAYSDFSIKDSGKEETADSRRTERKVADAFGDTSGVQ